MIHEFRRLISVSDDPWNEAGRMAVKMQRCSCNLTKPPTKALGHILTGVVRISDVELDLIYGSEHQESVFFPTAEKTELFIAEIGPEVSVKNEDEILRVISGLQVGGVLIVFLVWAWQQLA
ncbi:hypothetical protein [Agrobacterium tumefaciens]|uniref:hypothetical protein n=1 Tax=Agrobacterium tumefaciens TaxID=358 RepID=UPI001573D4C3|nr:hypothetical protein [Agrobacterium tumefaciens]NTC82578.1 hypothetical protein [Agrobacterium tumefaciens]NTD11401.1 hypothetical protein [Agrobacterium tumefaciens]NTD86722.1 hypothetical protein [Agrobacterium tumefaciens]NTD91449.1 hypothetical protein [Agrobacterium tumefaciens]NTD96920.1 hypothetical protein [Agrobacterium tumefaciens]